MQQKIQILVFLFYDEKNKNWYNNNLVTELLHHKVVKTQLKLITFIFENYNNNEKLTKLKEKAERSLNEKIIYN